MDPTQYLAHRVPGFADLSDQERRSILDFSLMWAAFENTVCDTHATPTSRLAVPATLSAMGRLEVADFEAPLTYFRARYFDPGKFTDFYAGLRFNQGSPNEALVRSVISGADQDRSTPSVQCC